MLIIIMKYNKSTMNKELNNYNSTLKNYNKSIIKHYNYTKTFITRKYNYKCNFN